MDTFPCPGCSSGFVENEAGDYELHSTCGGDGCARCQNDTYCPDLATVEVGGDLLCQRHADEADLCTCDTCSREVPKDDATSFRVSQTWECDECRDKRERERCDCGRHSVNVDSASYRADMRDAGRGRLVT